MNGQCSHLETHEERLALHICKGKIQIADISLLLVLGSIEDDMLQLCSQAMVKPVRQLLDVLCVNCHFLASHLTGLAKTNSERGWDSATANATLLQIPQPSSLLLPSPPHRLH